MTYAMETMYVRDNVPASAWERHLHLNTLLAPHHSQVDISTVSVYDQVLLTQ